MTQPYASPGRLDHEPGCPIHGGREADDMGESRLRTTSVILYSSETSIEPRTCHSALHTRQRIAPSSGSVISAPSTSLSNRDFNSSKVPPLRNRHTVFPRTRVPQAEASPTLKSPGRRCAVARSELSPAEMQACGLAAESFTLVAVSSPQRRLVKLHCRLA